MQFEINTTLNEGQYQHEYDGELFYVIFDLMFIAAGTAVDAINAAEADPYGNYFSILPASKSRFWLMYKIPPIGRIVS